jgi:ABC-type transport system involved in multi-copper enzyme maturation permease subunit
MSGRKKIMSNLIRGEWYKLRKSRYFFGMIFLAVIFGIFLTEMWIEDREMNPTFNDVIKNGAMSIQYAYERISMGSFLFALFGGMFIVNDFNNRNFGRSFSYGFRRSKLILSKLIVYILFSLFLELIYTTVLVIYASNKYGFCEKINANFILYLFSVVVSLILFSIATISIIAAVAVITRSFFITLVLPIIILSSNIFLYKNMGSYLFVLLSCMPWLRPLVNFQYEADNIISIISLVVTLSITIGGSLLFIGQKDITN